MYSKILSQGAYSVNDRRLLARSFQRPAPHNRLDTGAYLILTVLLSLGIWAGIWAVVTSLFSASL